MELYISSLLILVGEIYTAEVHHIRHNVVILLDDDGNEIIMPKDRQIPSDFYRKGDSIRGIIESVELKGTKPSIIMSRTSPKFLEKLFEQDIPEVFDGLIKLKKLLEFLVKKQKYQLIHMMIELIQLEHVLE